jgi:hypothetical protein|tara:strand:+ start:1099 stop:2166 length:1068 start_codon:yes stop_codon:yes gene_type:complete
MNRVLRRPMFRIGGSAGTGITSGLDRKGYKDGTDEYDRALKTTSRFMTDIDKFRGEEAKFTPSGLPGFLTQFGLNLLSTSPQGNIFQTAAVAAKEPFQTFQAAQLAERERQSDSAEDIFGTALASEYDITAKRLKSDDDRKTPEVEAQIIRDAQTNIFDARKILENPDATKEEITAANQKIKINQNILQKEIGVPAEYEAIISSEELFNSYKSSYVERENNRRIDEYKTKNPNATAEDIAENVIVINEDSPEAADFTITELRKKYYFAKGGRVGLKFGSEPKMMEEVAEQPRGEVQDLSYTELRARLPQEISNDIVQLLSQSKQALLDFANIQTPEDIASFNQQYEVSLTLPQGA